MGWRAVFGPEGGGGGGGGGSPRKKPIQPPDFSKIPGGDGWEGTGWEHAAKKKSRRRSAEGGGDFKRREPERAEHPRRVRGGIRLESESWPMRLGVFAQPLADLAGELVDRETLSEAFEDYAKRGQVKTLSVSRGEVSAVVQGRRYKPYSVTVRFSVHDAGRWEALVAGMDGRPQLAAKLLAGEMPEEMLRFAAEMGAPLTFGAGEVSRETTSAEVGDFDKHAACVLMLLAERVEREPLLLFSLRGLAVEEVCERLRQRRAVASSSTGAAAAYDPPRPAEADAASSPLDASVERFWGAGPELEGVDAPLRRPEVSHPILRRLGPSPFEEGRFPLVGLLATCYDTISEAALAEPEASDGGEPAGGGAGAEGVDGAGGGSDGGAVGPERVTRSRVKAKARAKKKG